MERQIITGLMAVLIALAGWNMHQVFQLSLDVEKMMHLHADQSDIQELKLAVQRLQILLQEDSLVK